MLDSPDGVLETATFCKKGDNKRPGLVPADPEYDPTLPTNPAQVCPSNLSLGVPEVTDAFPSGWFVRIQFDELLNGDKAEDLVPIPTNPTLNMGTLKNTQPVTLTCGGTEVAYGDGSFYNPSGNAFTWPLGPSLFISPPAAQLATVPTGSQCQVSIKPNVASVVDKSGNHVLDSELGPYTFQTAPLALLSTSPTSSDDATMPTQIDPASALVLKFNAFMNPTSLAAADVVVKTVSGCDSGATVLTTRTAKVTADPSAAGNVSALVDIADAGGDVGANNAWLAGKTYLVSFAANAQAKDAAGGGGAFQDPAAPLTVCFTTTGP